MVRSKALRRLVIPLAALALAAASVSPTFALTELKRTGSVGQFNVWDGIPNENGVWCRYNEAKHNRLDYVGVTAPTVWARDVTPTEDSQKVAWRVIVKRQKAGETAWTTYYRSETRKDVATDVTPTVFTNAGYGAGSPGFINFRLWVPYERDEGSRYWILVRVFWYGGDGRLEGSVTERLDHYMYLIWGSNGDAGDGFGDTSCHTHLVTIPQSG